jgi:mono/diheme cytochrome c family protein
VNNEGLNTVATTQQSPLQFARLAIITVFLCCLVALAIYIRPEPDDYTKSVLSLSGEPTKGRSIFVMNCVDCHGQWAAGKVGPSLKGVSDRLSRTRLIYQVVSGKTPPMPQFQPQPQEMADLLSYLEQL